jgi:hypothetical protein
MKNYFTADNCDYSEDQMKTANEAVAKKLAELGDPEGNDQDNVKNACDFANDCVI